MPIRLSRGWQKWSLVALVALFGAGYAYYAGRTFLASRYLAMNSRIALERAQRLEPDNAVHAYRLGRFAFVAEQDSAAALRHYQRAVELDQQASHYWLDLAVAYNAAGESSKLRMAVERALAVDPRTPENLWRAANLLMLDGDRARAFQVLRNLIGPRPEYAADAVSLAWRATRNADLVLQKVVPPEPGAQLAFLRMMLQQKQPEAAARAWQALVTSGRPFVASEAFPYVEYLLAQGDGAGARKAWTELAQADRALAPYIADQSGVVNAGFESPVLGRGLDWRHASRPGVTLDTNGEPHRGQHALTIQFDGTPRDAGIEQWLAVEPGKSYLFRAFYKAESEGVGLPRLAIMTPNGNTIGLSEELRNSKDWAETHGFFATGAGQSVMVLRVTRDPGTTRIRGRFLLDDVSIAPEK
jgi:tetratricopeptide (TPR) repeat protein